MVEDRFVFHLVLNNKMKNLLDFKVCRKRKPLSQIRKLKLSGSIMKKFII